MLRRVAPEPARGLLQLTLATDPVAASGLVPGDGHMDEPLVEVAFLGRRRAPRVLEFLVGGEELAAADQIQAAGELRRRP